MPSSLIGLSHVLASSLLASSFAAPLEWSPNGQWLAYTIIDAESTSMLREGWLLTKSNDKEAPRATQPAPTARFGGKHRVWASRFGTNESALIEESRWPISSPTWAMDGRSLVFARFVPASDDPDQTLVRGRYEAVVQSGLDEKKVVVAVPDLELEAEQLATIIDLKPSVSPDGRFLALPRPGKSPGVVIVRLDPGAVVKTIEGARDPVWAPDGLRLLFVLEAVRGTGDAARVLHVLNRNLGSAHPVKTDLVVLDNPPVWSLDGQSILAVARPAPGAIRSGTKIDLVRIGIDAGPSIRMMTFEQPGAAMLRNRAMQSPAAPGIPGAQRAQPALDTSPVVVESSLSLDREHEQCVALIQLSGQEQAFTWCNVRTQNTAKRFHPLDLSLRVGAPAISPDGQTVAFRVEAPGMLGLPAFCELPTEAVTPIAPDGPTRRVWLELLASCSSDILKAPAQPAAGRKPSNAATILPSPVELGGHTPRQIRLRRLAKIAQGLIDQPLPADAHDQPAKETETAMQDELRLFFDYLRGDYPAAESRLGAVESRTDDPDDRLRLLCLRSQILFGQGEVERARGIATYVDRATRPLTHAIEDTPLGPVMTSNPNLRSEWSNELTQSLNDTAVRRLRNQLGGDMPNPEGLESTAPGVWEVLDPRLGAPQPRFPFAPGDRDEAVEGLDPAQFGGRMPVIPPRPRFAPPPVPNQPNEPAVPRL
jgi:WD40-like Beta Propeller Repeat